MNKYYIRTIAAHYDEMIAIGKLLGVIEHVPGFTAIHERQIAWTPDEWVQQQIPADEWDDPDEPEYETVNIGAQPTAWETVTEVVPERIYATQGGCWDYIGPIHVPTGETTQTEMGPVPVMTPLVDPDGNEYIHVNLITPVDLITTAAELASENQAVADWFANLDRYFMLDGNGHPAVPSNPHRVFAGM